MRNLAVITAFLTACSVTEPEPEPEATGEHDGAIEVGACEGSGLRDAIEDTAAPAPVVDAHVDGDRFVVELGDLSANCCPTPSATFAADGSDVTLTFRDVTGTDSCDCWCITDFTVTSDPFPAGEYTLEVLYWDDALGTFPLSVP